jgi:microcystin-dependent protein
MAEPFIAEVRIFAGTFAPRDWAFCNGQLLPIAQNTALFAVVGTIYGGDGRTTLGLPNLQGRAPMHPGRGPGLTPRTLGQRGGTEQVTLTAAQIPAHNHVFQASSNDRNSTDPAGKVLSTTTSDFYADPPPAAEQQLAEETLDETGEGQAHNNQQPFLTLNFIIALFGVFPTRG